MCANDSAGARATGSETRARADVGSVRDCPLSRLSTLNNTHAQPWPPHPCAPVRDPPWSRTRARGSALGHQSLAREMHHVMVPTIELKNCLTGRSARLTRLCAPRDRELPHNPYGSNLEGAHLTRLRTVGTAVNRVLCRFVRAFRSLFAPVWDSPLHIAGTGLG